LPLEGGDVPLTETPLPPLLEGRQHALARELVHGVGAQVEDLRDLFAIEHGVVGIQHVALPRAIVLHGVDLSIAQATIKEQRAEVVAHAESQTLTFEFSRELPSSGSAYTFVREGLGARFGFLTGWIGLIAIVLGVPGVYAVTWKISAALQSLIM